MRFQWCTHTRIHAYTHIHTHTHACMHAHKSKNVYTRTYTSARKYTGVWMWTHALQVWLLLLLWVFIHFLLASSQFLDATLSKCDGTNCAELRIIWAARRKQPLLACSYSRPHMFNCRQVWQGGIRHSHSFARLPMARFLNYCLQAILPGTGCCYLGTWCFKGCVSVWVSKRCLLLPFLPFQHITKSSLVHAFYSHTCFYMCSMNGAACVKIGKLCYVQVCLSFLTLRASP
jgi:hypothetical protein